MAADAAVELTGVSLSYRIPKEAVQTLKEYAIRKVQGRIEHGELVALRDATLSIAPGERVGVVGPNGAGKSTLFRVIARVRRPTQGRVVVRGRVAPLLELGLGFHGELTGRENVVLHGAVMGHSRRDMERRMDAIAEFAELEAFLDAPLRTYSTGMAARLAFAVATDVDPDILLVDEALSVGDERFQAKCHARMAQFPRTRQDLPPRVALAFRGHCELFPGALDLGGPHRAGWSRRRRLRFVPRVGTGRRAGLTLRRHCQ